MYLTSAGGKFDPSPVMLDPQVILQRGIQVYSCSFHEEVVHVQVVTFCGGAHCLEIPVQQLLSMIVIACLAFQVNHNPA